MTYFLRRGSVFSTTNQANIDISQSLPKGVYGVIATQEGYKLEVLPSFDLKGKLYGDLQNRVDRIINTFNDRPASTGVLLAGDKGSGKTLLTKKLSMDLEALGVITIIVSGPYAGDGFNTFIQSIDQPALVLFDEFEKVYKPELQQHLLTLFDGTYSTKKLFVATTNDNLRISDYMKNRPGRFFYKFDYKGLDENFIREYCDDALKNKKHTDSVVFFASTFRSFNFDLLKALVEEMNRYGESVQDAAKYLNAVPNDTSARFEVVEFIAKDEKYKGWTHHKDVAGGQAINPFHSGQIYITMLNDAKKASKSGSMASRKTLSPIRNDEDDYDEDEIDFVDMSGNPQKYIYFTSKDIVSLEKDTYTMENESGFLVMRKKSFEKRPTIWDFIE